MHRFITKLLAAFFAAQITLQVTAPTLVRNQLERIGQHLGQRSGRWARNERGSVTFEHAAWATVAILVVGIAAAAIKTLINKNVLSIK